MFINATPYYKRLVGKGKLFKDSLIGVAIYFYIILL